MAVYNISKCIALLYLSVISNIASAYNEKHVENYSDDDLLKVVLLKMEDMQAQIKKLETSESSFKQSVSVFIENAAQFRLQIEDLTKTVERLEKSDKEKDERIAILENELERSDISNCGVKEVKQLPEHEPPERKTLAREGQTTTRVSNGEVESNRVAKHRRIRQTPQVAFSAYLDHVIKDLGKNQPIVYNMILLNEAAAYSGSSGIFHVPVSGVYLFSWSVTAKSLPGEHAYDIWVKLVVNGIHKVGAVAESRNDYDDNQGSNTVVLRLQQGDQVWTAHYGDQTEIFGDGYERTTSFTGVLLYLT